MANDPRSNPRDMLTGALVSLAMSATLAAPRSLAAAEDDAKPRVIVLTDIGNEPDDSESMVRFLLYSNEFDVEGLLAVTSTWLRDAVHPDLIEERVKAYAKVLPNLKVHAAGYPEANTLISLIKSGRAEYGMRGVGAGKDTEASRRIIDAVDRQDPRPLWLTLWGGSVDLAQALWSVKSTRASEALSRFVDKLRVFSISDQDDAASWIRANFPTLFWVESTHAFGDYHLATWPGISAPLPGADPTVVSQSWLDAHIRIGPMGALYPPPKYLMEGDSSSFLYLIPTGLGSTQHPDWGSWGGRYGLVGPSLGLWSDTTDSVTGIDGMAYATNQATVWRWRRDFQNDFAARIAWTMSGDFKAANHAPEVVLNRIAGHAPVTIRACANQSVELSAEGSRDPDGDRLTYSWWQYREASGGINPQQVTISNADSEKVTVKAPVTVKPAPNVDVPFEVSYHIVLRVSDNGSPSLTRYRRVILNIPTRCPP